MECLIVADDLTGAADAAGPFAARGYSTRVALHPAPHLGAIDVLAISTDTRDALPHWLPPILQSIARARHHPRIVFKKIDSTLRGNAPAEISAALEAFGLPTAIATPAFPAMGRIVAAGRLSIAGQPNFTHIDVPAYFQRAAIACHHTAPADFADALTRNRVLTCDASTDADLDAIVAAGLSSSIPLLWAGSSGLAAALARAVRAPAPTPPGPVPEPCPLLVCAGSDHPATLAQQTTLLARRGAALLSAETCRPESISDALTQNRPVILRLPRGAVTPRRVRALLAPVASRPAALLVTGGDTATLLFHALDIRSLTLRGEIAPGIPHALIDDGPFHSRPIVTKSGGFGASDALIEIVDYFACPQTPATP
jgi:uncharacterized protein YgbK (DUF1537 family)